MKLTLFKKHWDSPVAFEGPPIQGLLEYKLIVDWRGPRFTMTAGNISACTRGPLACIMHVLEHESVGMAKYDRLKEHLRDLKMWNTI